MLSLLIQMYLRDEKTSDLQCLYERNSHDVRWICVPMPNMLPRPSCGISQVIFHDCAVPSMAGIERSR